MASKKPVVLTNGQLEVIQAGDIIPIENLAFGTPDGTKFIRDDGTLATPPGGGGSVATSLELNAGTDNTKFASASNLKTSKYGAAQELFMNLNFQ